MFASGSSPVTRLKILITTLLRRIVRGLVMHLSLGSPESNHTHNVWLAATQDLAKRTFREAKLCEMYYLIIKELEELDYENLRARYLTGYSGYQARRSSFWCRLSPHLGVVLREMERERAMFTSWLSNVRDDGRLLHDHQPPRQWNSLFLKISTVAPTMPCAKRTEAPWPFARIIRVLRESRDRQLESSAPGTSTASSRLDRLTPMQRAVVLTRDSMVLKRTPDLYNAEEAKAIQRKVEELSARLLRRIIRSDSGMLVGCYFRDDERPMRYCSAPPVMARSEDDVWGGEAVPRVEVRGGRIVRVEGIADEDDGQRVVVAFRLPDEDRAKWEEDEVAWLAVMSHMSTSAARV